MPRPSPAGLIPFGPYQLIQRIGSGGMAEVWTATRKGSAGTFAVKQILPHLTDEPGQVQMFLSEARCLVRLDHPNIVRFVEFGEVDGTYFLAMEHVHGKNLRALLGVAALIGRPPGLGAFVAREVCAALAHVHEMTDGLGQPLRLVHRDVSPSNVMVGYDGTVKLVDFGIAKGLADTATRTRSGVRKGTLSYMSPEQVDGRPLDQRSDLFSVGVVLHEALTGGRLFSGRSDPEIEDLVRQAAVGPPSAVNRAVPPALDRICLRALARDPNHRYASAREMLADLDDVTQGLAFGPRDLVTILGDHFPRREPVPSVATRSQTVQSPWARSRVGRPLLRIVAGLFGLTIFVLVGLGARSGRTGRLPLLPVVERAASVAPAPEAASARVPERPTADGAPAPVKVVKAKRPHPRKRRHPAEASERSGDYLPDPFERARR